LNFPPGDRASGELPIVNAIEVPPNLFQWLCPCCSPLSYTGSGAR
jgi:hypothetical protein